MKHRIITILVTNIIWVSLFLSGCSTTIAPAGQTFEVKRGDLDIIVSTDGSLAMPDVFDLKFGTNGQVDEILVEEGDSVKKGALLALLDNTAQKNAIKTALFNMQTARNNITFGCDPDHLPYNYPDLSVSRLADEAQKDMDAASRYFMQGNYKDAGSYLVMAYFDIEVCEDLITYRPNAAVLAGAKTNSIYYPDITAGSSVPESEYDAAAVDFLRKYRGKLLDITREMKIGAYEKIAPLFDAAHQQMFTVTQLAKSTVYLKSRMVFQYADTASSVDFLQSSLRSLQDLQQYLAQDDAVPVEAAKKLYIAKLNLLVGRDILENQTLIFESGGSINWKTLQQYNLSLQSAEIALYKAKREIMKTAIIAPSDGTVVSVDLKKSYVLSAQDYSSRTAVKIVDTKYVRFAGLVDEIDIIKIKPGQTAKITVDAMPNKAFTGTVKFISPFGVKTGQVVKFAVTIELEASDAPLRGGLSATADIMVASVKNALLVPVSAVLSTPAGNVVSVIDPATGQAERRQVTIGIQNLQYAEVLSGLKEGDKVQVSQKGSGSAATGQPRPGAGAANPMRVLR